MAAAQVKTTRRALVGAVPSRILGTLSLKKSPSTEQGNTVPATPINHVNLASLEAGDELALPNERDQKVGATGGIPSAVVQQAARDLKRGLQDTSKGLETDAAYAKLRDS